MMTLHIEETGTSGAASIVFLHGIGASGWMWAKQRAALGDFHCLTVDLPGHGQSNQVAWVSLAGTTERVAEIIRAHATNGRAHVVGLSLGGYVGLTLLAHHADAVDHVVLSGVTAAPMPNRSLLPLQLGLMGFLLKRRWFVKQQAKGLGVPPEMQAAFADNLRAMSMDAYRAIWREAAEYRVPDALRGVDAPALIVAGGGESDIITQAVRTIPAMMPNSQGRLAPRLGHGWNVQAPDLFSAMVRAWISDAALPAELRAP